MDPLTILGISAAVVQFVDFGTKLLSHATGAYKSATGKESTNAALSTVSEDIQLLCGEVDKKLAVFAATVPSGSLDEVYLRLCSQCGDIARELNNAISKLQARGMKNQCQIPGTGDSRCTRIKDTTWNTLTIMLQSILSEKRIGELREKMHDTRQQVSLAALVCLWDDAKKQGKILSQISQQQLDIMSTLNRIDMTAQNFGQELHETVGGANRDSQTCKDIESAIWSARWQPEYPLPGSSTSSEKASSLLKMDISISRIVHSLLFPTMKDREATIQKSYADTYHWIFSDAPCPEVVLTQQSWSGFSTWLQNRTQDIFWITGKPGSGKSTLMKFIAAHPVVEENLSRWSGSLPFIKAVFYSWNAGTVLQKSHEGLLRSLLHQCLSQQHHLVPAVCPRRWEATQMLERHLNLPDWSLAELMECLNSLFLACRGQYNLVFFIDGLDEFNGDHSQLVEFIKDLSQQNGIKICVTSRPWNVFNDTFIRSPSLRLQDLTRGDIKRYVIGNFNECPAYKELYAISIRSAEQLVQTILDKADGVFLWVSLVVRTLVVQMREGDKFADLQATLDSLPGDLGNLFDAIWRRIDERYLSDASRFILLLENSLMPLRALAVWIIDEEDNLALDFNTMERLSQSSAEKIVRRRLNSRTLGLLETSPGGLVTYLHRTVQEWVKSGNTLETIYTARPMNFDPRLELLTAETVLLREKGLWQGRNERDIWEHMANCLSYAARVENSDLRNERLTQLLDKWDINAREMSGRSLEWPRIQPWSTSGCSFIGLAAQFCLLPYLQDKVTDMPSVLQSDPSNVHLLGHAVFGRDYFEQRWAEGFIGKLEPLKMHYFVPERRLELVHFLLAHGVNTSRKKDIERQVSRLVGQNWRGEKTYWIAVGKLLKSHNQVWRALSIHRKWEGRS
ncbi:hypothetical protein BGZ60DRAFT_530669 [Tricladium varicosporioides]|nr:hypothetical protein BGZ60DRAFT_530669 [Hymenoscyphus varicosporioides]